VQKNRLKGFKRGMFQQSLLSDFSLVGGEENQVKILTTIGPQSTISSERPLIGRKDREILLGSLGTPGPGEDKTGD